MVRYCWYTPQNIECVDRAQELNKSMEDIGEAGKLPTEEKCKEIYENILYLENYRKFIHERMMKLSVYKNVIEETKQTQNSKKQD